MHEVSLMMHALELAEEAARREGASRIVGLTLRVGAMAGVVPEAMAFAFEVVRQGTMAADARLEWEEVPIRCRCRACGHEFEPDGFAFACEACRSPDVEMLQGRELQLVSIEIASD